MLEKDYSYIVNTFVYKESIRLILDRTKMIEKE